MKSPSCWKLFNLFSLFFSLLPPSHLPSLSRCLLFSSNYLTVHSACVNKFYFSLCLFARMVFPMRNFMENISTTQGQFHIHPPTFIHTTIHLSIHPHLSTLLSQSRSRHHLSFLVRPFDLGVKISIKINRLNNCPG